MAGAEEAASFGSHLNGDLDPDDREEGVSSTAEEAAKKKRRKKKKGKGAVSAVQQEPDKEAASVDEVAGQLERQALDEKERDDDDEGNSPFALWFQRLFSFCVCCVPVCKCTTFMLVP